MEKNDGGPFHPCEVEHIDGEVYGIQTGVSRSIHTGASLRDHFAGLAMLGWRDTNRTLKEDAEDAYRMADAMLAARKVTP